VKFAVTTKLKTSFMKKTFFLTILMTFFFSYQGYSQTLPEDVAAKEFKKVKPKFGLKLGYNVSKLSGSTPNFSPKVSNGFNVSAFYATPSRGLGYRTELIFSRQGFSFDGSGKMQRVSQDYIYMPHLTTFTIAKKVQLQAGGQIGYLLNAKKHSSASTTDENKIMDYMNRIDYGAAAGVEIYPYKGFIIGGRYNISLGTMYKQASEVSLPSPSSLIGSFLPVNPADFKGKNAVMQFFIGYKF
jgi:hypothetical protein